MDKKYFRNITGETYPCKLENQIPCAREERFEIIIELQPFAVVYMMPSDEQMFITGYLYCKQIINDLSEAVSTRLCEANRFHIYLCEEVKLKINAYGSIHNYLLSTPSLSWGDIVFIKQSFKLSNGVIGKIIETIEDSITLRRLMSFSFFMASMTESGTVSSLYADCNPETLADKIMGAHINGEGSYKITVTNCFVNFHIMQRLYAIKTAVLIVMSPPSHTALLIARKAGIAVILHTLGKTVVMEDSGNYISY